MPEVNQEEARTTFYGVVHPIADVTEEERSAKKPIKMLDVPPEQFEGLAAQLPGKAIRFFHNTQKDGGWPDSAGTIVEAYVHPKAGIVVGFELDGTKWGAWAKSGINLGCLDGFSLGANFYIANDSDTPAMKDVVEVKPFEVSLCPLESARRGDLCKLLDPKNPQDARILAPPRNVKRHRVAAQFATTGGSARAIEFIKSAEDLEAAFAAAPYESSTVLTGLWPAQQKPVPVTVLATATTSSSPPPPEMDAPPPASNNTPPVDSTPPPPPPAAETTTPPPPLPEPKSEAARQMLGEIAAVTQPAPLPAPTESTPPPPAPTQQEQMVTLTKADLDKMLREQLREHEERMKKRTLAEKFEKATKKAPGNMQPVLKKAMQMHFSESSTTPISDLEELLAHASTASQRAPAPTPVPPYGAHTAPSQLREIPQTATKPPPPKAEDEPQAAIRVHSQLATGRVLHKAGEPGCPPLFTAPVGSPVHGTKAPDFPLSILTPTKRAEKAFYLQLNSLGVEKQAIEESWQTRVNVGRKLGALLATVGGTDAEAAEASYAAEYHAALRTKV